MRGHKMHTNEQIEAKSAKHQAAAQHQIKSSGSQDEMRVFDCGVCSGRGGKTSNRSFCQSSKAQS